MRCAIWYHLDNLKNREKHPWKSATFSTKSNTPPWVFLTFFKSYKWYQIVQNVSNKLKNEVVKSWHHHSPPLYYG